MVNRMYLVKFSQKAKKDKKALKRAGLEKKAKELLNLIAQNPLQTPPYQKLVGALEGNCSMRINIQHRIVYEVYEAKEGVCDSEGPYEGVVLIKRMWTHYERIR